MPRLLPGCRRRLAAGGFATVVGCRQSRWLRCRGVICRLLSARRSRSCTPSVSGCVRSLAVWVGRRRRSRASWAATRRRAATRSCIGPRWRSGRRSDAPAARRFPSSPRTTRCAGMYRSATPARSPGPRESRCRGRMRAGSVVGRVADRTDAGRRRGAREQIANRLRIDVADDESMRISHEAIYQALYVQGRGALKRELVACLRTGRALRVPRAPPGRVGSSSPAPR
jgi:hypothetical protein